MTDTVIYKVQGCEIEVNDPSISEKEAVNYLNQQQKKYPRSHILKLSVNLDGDFVNLKSEFELEPFQRIRRITGYLVGTLDRFNNAKRHEVDDRLKHSV